MGALQNFERRLEQAISGAFAKAFRSAVQPVEIAAALQRECRQQRPDPLAATGGWCPTGSTSSCPQTDLERLSPYDSAMASELADQLQDHADTRATSSPARSASPSRPPRT